MDPFPIPSSFAKLKAELKVKLKDETRINTNNWPKPGTCNFFQVAGQIATLQWSQGPDNVTHVCK